MKRSRIVARLALAAAALAVSLPSTASAVGLDDVVQNNIIGAPLLTTTPTTLTLSNHSGQVNFTALLISNLDTTHYSFDWATPGYLSIQHQIAQGVAYDATFGGNWDTGANYSGETTGTYSVDAFFGDRLALAVGLFPGQSLNFSFTPPVGAPEIDGGKLPLAALLLGLVAVIAQRKRTALLAA